jgi:hypothetical protein
MMSVSTPEPIPCRSAEATPSRSPGGASWLKFAAIAAILAASGASRLWQEQRVERTLEAGRVAPFPLATLPMTIGPWEGKEATLDPQVVRIAGCTDHIGRRYVDRRTGVSLDVIVLYGPTVDMIDHVPEVCYPSAGYQPMPGVHERPVPIGEGPATAPFLSLAYTKGEGGLADSQEVYYSLRYGGRWTTRPVSSKGSRRMPGMFKVQASRRISARERRDVDRPTEPLLAALVGEIEARLARTGAVASE